MKKSLADKQRKIQRDMIEEYKAAKKAKKKGGK